MNNGSMTPDNGYNYSELHSETHSDSPVAPSSPVVYNMSDTVAAIASLAAGYLLCRAFPVYSYPLGAAITLLLITAGVLFVCVKMGHASVPFAAGSGIILTLLAVSMILNGSSPLRFFAACLFFFTVYYTLGRSFGATIEKIPRQYFFYDALKSAFVLPMMDLWAIFPAIFRKRGTQSEKKVKITKNILFALLGLLLAVIPAAIAALLLSYDQSFEQLMTKIFDFDISDIMSHAGSLICAVPIAMTLFSAFFCSVHRRAEHVLTEENADKIRKKSKFLPVSLSAAVCVPVIFIYLIFFFSQKEYYLAAFTGVLPDGFSFAEYAREGFFNLCAVAGLNACLLVTLSAFTHKHDDGGSTLPERIVAVTLSVSTLILITTALAKMYLYISQYGLTRLRVLTSGFMIFLFLAFACVIIRQFAKKFNLTAALLAIFILFFGAFCVCDTDTLIAEYNTEAYLSGEHDNIDLREIFNLRDSGVPSLVRVITESEDENTSQTAAMWLSRTVTYTSYVQDKEKERSVFAFDLPHFRAVRSIRQNEEKVTAKVKMYKDNHPVNPTVTEKNTSREYPVYVILHTETPIDSITVTYFCLGDIVSSVSVSNANGSPLESRVSHLMCTEPIALPEGVREYDIEIEVIVVTSEGEEFSLGMTPYTERMSGGKAYVHVYGDSQTGFKY